MYKISKERIPREGRIGPPQPPAPLKSPAWIGLNIFILDLKTLFFIKILMFLHCTYGKITTI